MSQKQIATMASDLAQSSNPEPAGGRKDLEHWATTLAYSLPGEAAQSLVRGVQTGVLEGIRDRLDAKQLATVEYGAGALVDGTTRFIFGREAHHSYAIIAVLNENDVLTSRNVPGNQGTSRHTGRREVGRTRLTVV